ncbi:UNVERIFIED_ORG: dipeptidase [Paraburkholderia sediminicola]|jgi:dipeptidase|uniref:C69 family dipeptidase n=1 Tax=Paraburkholderia TaxID=1822464 RepID=UPI002112BEB4|nr:MULTISPECIES: C69 family dipeptidase [Paraburkholderia]MCP2091170.1 dipeptidase [Paraburkholderia sediminicola]MCX4140745.1 C69 family dipeptidase [Paraburkholderia aspalathi]MDN7173429.1 C69 family dipeptidase [Paraburkholderia sp. SEWSISQ10-3 4]MDQ6503070.1 C69 family dipeptidase [Paraburkholderia aspalathi]
MCTSVMVGKKAMADGIILLSRNEDFTRNNWNKYLVYRTLPQYRSGDKHALSQGQWVLGNGLTVPVPERAYGYSAIPDWAGYEEAVCAIGDRYFYEERGINQRNVAVSATNSLAINDKANAADPLLASGGIAESVIPTLILPQAETALQAVELLGQYVETYGTSEVNGVLFGDPEESWYFENGSAHHWIAVRILPETYLVVANGMRVHGVDLDDVNVRHSKELFPFIVQHQLLDQPDRRHLNFSAAFGILGNPYNEDRIWLAQSILTPSLVQQPGQPQYPLFLKPDRKLGVKDVMAVLRATYQGTVLEGKAKRPIGYEATAESHIITLDASMPVALQGVIWQVISTPLGAPYMPFFNTMDVLPPGYTLGSNEYGTLSAYWAFRGLYALASSQGEKALAELTTLWSEYERNCVEEHGYIKRMLQEMDRRAPTGAVDFTRRYSTGIAYETVGVAHSKRNELMTKITVSPEPG